MADRQTFEGIVEFSKASRYLCHADVNGVVKIWDVITGVLKQEYVPSSHLSVQCTCISWSPNCESKSKVYLHFRLEFYLLEKIDVFVLVLICLFWHCF